MPLVAAGQGWQGPVGQRRGHWALAGGLLLRGGAACCHQSDKGTPSKDTYLWGHQLSSEPPPPAMSLP